MFFIACLVRKGTIDHQRRCASKKSTEGLLRRLVSNDSSKLSKEESPTTSRRVQEKKSTLDDFFANLGETGKRKPLSRIKRDRLSSLTAAVSEVETVQKVDMVSFFNNVNKIMESNKKNPPCDHTETKSETSRFKTTAASPSSTSSIMDLLPPILTRRPDAFDEEAFHQYADIIDTMVSTDCFRTSARGTAKLKDEEVKAVVDWLLADQPVVKYTLPTLENLLQTGNPSKEDEEALRQSLTHELQSQKTKFLEHLGWNKLQYLLAVKTLQRLGRRCAKMATGLPAEVGWEKLKEVGLNVRGGVVQTYLYVTSTFSIRFTSSHATPGTSVLDFLDNDHNINAEQPIDKTQEELVDENDAKAATEVALVHDILYGASEQSTSIRIRRLVSQKKPAEAEKLLESNASEELRLRTYDPLFQSYLEQNDIAAALKLYLKMRGEGKVHLRPETYIQLMSGMAENGFFQPQSPPVLGAFDLGYDPPSGPKLFNRLAGELADDAVEISAAAAKRLYNAMVKGFHDHNLKPLHLLQSLEVCNDAATSSELVASRVSINSSTGQCPRTGVYLRLINLDDAQKEKLKEGLHYLAAVSYEERTGQNGAEAETHLRDFGRWLADRTEKPFTAIVDGANVGYYFQNFEQGRFSFHQIQFVVDSLEAMGENTLVILPRKYTQNSFMLTNSSGTRRQSLTQREKDIRNRLISSGKAYVVPPSSLDDYYWMYASVSGQGEKWTCDQQYVSPNNAEGRWPGIRPMLVSNDQMRDHKLSLLEPRLFRRWYSNFIVNFTFSAFVGDQCVDKEIGFSTADFYSHEIQGNDVLDGDRNCGTAWHFPVSDWEDDESFCVRIPLN